MLQSELVPEKGLSANQFQKSISQQLKVHMHDVDENPIYPQNLYPSKNQNNTVKFLNMDWNADIEFTVKNNEVVTVSVAGMTRPKQTQTVT
ncbi:hypothetical protein L1887_03882 [Cichorium endivia]|nr:hypothetical protein L1887_03882 [Cichorium endivia]